MTRTDWLLLVLCAAAGACAWWLIDASLQSGHHFLDPSYDPRNAVIFTGETNG